VVTVSLIAVTTVAVVVYLLIIAIEIALTTIVVSEATL